MSQIHFVEKINKYKLVDQESDEWESGNWVVSVESASKLIHGSIYLHRGQKEPSFVGGRIVGFRTTEAKNGKKVIFRFKRLQSHEGITTELEGWGNEQKRVWAEG